jgi:cell division inhibitor SulA
MSALITHLKNKQLLWQASHTEPATDKTATGIEVLDKALQGGFPKRGLARIHSTMGIGELRLCMPVLKQRQQDQRQLFMIAPPATINAEMLHEYELSIERTFFINSDDQAAQLWACEQCLKSGCSHTVVLWCNRLSLNQAKRLQVAAEQGDSLLLVYQYSQAVQALPVNLSLSLSRREQKLRVNITKQRGGWPVDTFDVQQTLVSLRNSSVFDKQTTTDNVVALRAH